MVTTQPFPSHKEAMTFSCAARSGTVVGAPTPSFFLQSHSPTKLQFIFCLCLPPPQTAFREKEYSPPRACVKLSKSVVSVPFLTWLIQESQKIDPAAVLVLFLLLFFNKKDNKASSWAQRGHLASSCQVPAIVTLARMPSSVHQSTAPSTLSGLSSSPDPFLLFLGS